MARAVREKNSTIKRLSQLKSRLAKREIDEKDRCGWAMMRDELRHVCEDAAKEDETPLVLALMEACKGRSVIPENGPVGKRKRVPTKR